MKKISILLIAAAMMAGGLGAEDKRDVEKPGAEKTTIDKGLSIDVILNDEGDAPARFALPSTKEAKPGEDTVVASTSTVVGYRIMEMKLNDFAQAMAQRAGLTYVANPNVKGTVSGRFSDGDPLRMLRAAARANGYQVVLNGRVLELVNREVEAAQPPVTYSRQLRYLRFPGKAEEQSTKMEALFSGLLSEKAYIKYDPKTNTLVARDIDSNVALLDDLVRRLDVERPNVLTSVTIMEVNANPHDYQGLDWGQTLGAAGFSSTLDIANSLSSVLTGGAFGVNPKYAVIIRPGQVRIIIRALKEKNLGEVRAQFFVSTEDNEVGRTVVARKEPIPNFQANQQTGGFDISGFTYEEIGSTLTVTPQLLPNNIVRLTIKPALSTSNQTRTFTSSAGTGGGLSAAIPIIEERSTEVVVRVPLGRSLMLGGLKQLSLLDNSNKVPILGDIPLFKYLFSTKDVLRQTRNIVLVVEPSILDPYQPDSIEAMTERYRDSMKYNPKDKLMDNIITTKEKSISGLVDDKAPNDPEVKKVK